MVYSEELFHNIHGGTEERINSFNGNSQFSYLDSNPGPLRYEAGAPTTTRKRWKGLIFVVMKLGFQVSQQRDSELR
jgi:hypothetical protein